jgi:hypothetical protein
MKKIIILLCLIVYWFASYSQIIARIEVSNKNVGLSFGKQLGDYAITGGYIVSYKMPVSPLILHLSVEKRIMIKDIDEDTHKAIYFIPSLGIGRVSFSYFSRYNDAHNYLIDKKVEYLPILGLSVAKTANIGIFTFGVKYCKEPFIILGLSAFIGKML